MATVTENRTLGLDSRFLHISPKRLGLTKLGWGKSIQHDEIYLWSNFGENLLTYVGVIALFGPLLKIEHWGQTADFYIYLQIC